jgi:DNA-binding SARP family transcriptional activator
VEFRLLGPLEVRDGAGSVIALRRRQQRALLGALLIRAGEVVSVDRLVDDLWGENPPASAVGSLQNTVSQLRKLLEPLGKDILRRQAPGYVLDVPAEAIDARRFERLVAAAAGLEPAQRAASLREALALWRGPALDDLTDEPWAEVEASRLEELRLEALEERIQADLELGRHATLVAELEAVTVDHPLHERLHGQLALALYRSGRQADALEVFRWIRTALDNLGIQPSAELRQLERDILNQSPAVAPPVIEVDEAPEEEAGERRLVSVLAADIPAEDDPEALSALLRRVLEAARDGVARHGGELERFGPEGLVAIFGADASREDDALRAVRAGVELHELTGVAVGVATGEAVIGGEPRVAGSAVARAAGLARTGTGVLVGPRTLALVRDAATLEEAGGLARVLAVNPERPDDRAETPFVGRSAELTRLGEALDDRGAVLEIVVGEAGIGKTRLARELTAGFDGSVLEGRCAAYGEGATFVPLVDALRGVDVEAALAGGEDAELVSKRIAALAGAAHEPGSLGETYWAVRRLLESLAAARPVLLVLEDVHWAEPALLDLVEYLDARLTGTPVELLCLARPELLDARPAWVARTIALEPLAEDATRELVGATAELEDEARERIVELAEGNPLYAQQLATFAAESGKALEPGAMPATIDAVLAGRLGRLEAGERATLQRAAVVGREFSRGAVAALAPPDLAVDAHLLALARRGFVRPLPDPLPGDDAYRFHHVLLRDAAYATLTKDQRADLHQKVATWLDRDGPGDDALVGYHLEQAVDCLAELGRPASELAGLAGERLGAAGIKAWTRADGSAASRLLRRGARLVRNDSRRAEFLYELGIVEISEGRRREGLDALDGALEAALSARDERLEYRIRLEAVARRAEASPDAQMHLALSTIAALEAFGDHRGLARAWLTVAGVHSWRCEMDAMGDAARRAAGHYAEAGFSNGSALNAVGDALYFGTTPTNEGIRICGELRDQASDRGGEANVISALGALHALQGEFGQARDLIEHARRTSEELGDAFAILTVVAPRLIDLDWLAGDLDAAASLARATIDLLVQAGREPHAATRAVQLADIELDRGDEKEAAKWLLFAKGNAVEHDALMTFLNRAVEARLLARRGQHGRAQRLANDAVMLGARTDAVLDRARTLVALIEVALAAGRVDEADAAATEGEHLLGAKGASAGLTRLRRPTEAQLA